MATRLPATDCQLPRENPGYFKNAACEARGITGLPARHSDMTEFTHYPVNEFGTADEGARHRRPGDCPRLSGAVLDRRRVADVLFPVAGDDGPVCARSKVHRWLLQVPGAGQLRARGAHGRGDVVHDDPGRRAHHRHDGRRVSLDLGHRVDVLLPGNRRGLLLLPVRPQT